MQEAEEDKQQAANASKENGKGKGGTTSKQKCTKAKTPRVPPVFATHEDWVRDRTQTRAFSFVPFVLGTLVGNLT